MFDFAEWEDLLSPLRKVREIFCGFNIDYCCVCYWIMLMSMLLIWSCWLLIAPLQGFRVFIVNKIINCIHQHDDRAAAFSLDCCCCVHTTSSLFICKGDIDMSKLIWILSDDAWAVAVDGHDHLIFDGFRRTFNLLLTLITLFAAAAITLRAVKAAYNMLETCSLVIMIC